MDKTSSASAYFQVILLFAFIIPAVLFLLTQQKALQVIRKPNRRMAPGLVWLQIIPLFGQVWQFFVVARIANSIKKELASRQDDSIIGSSDVVALEDHGKRPTFAIGITYCILYLIGLFVNLFTITTPDNVDLITMIVGGSFLGGMICWIVYWVQLAQYRRKLKRAEGF